MGLNCMMEGRPGRLAAFGNLDNAAGAEVATRGCRRINMRVPFLNSKNMLESI